MSESNFEGASSTGKEEMSTRTPLVLNGWLLLLIAVLLFIDGLFIFFAPLIIAVANGFMFFKALWRKEYQLAILYFIITAVAIAIDYYITKDAHFMKMSP